VYRFINRAVRALQLGVVGMRHAQKLDALFLQPAHRMQNVVWWRAQYAVRLARDGISRYSSICDLRRPSAGSFSGNFTRPLPFGHHTFDINAEYSVEMSLSSNVLIEREPMTLA